MAPELQNSRIHIKSPDKDPGFLNQVPTLLLILLVATSKQLIPGNTSIKHTTEQAIGNTNNRKKKKKPLKIEYSLTFIGIAF